MMLRRLFPEQETGFYIDVGAGEPERLSVTKHFYDRGWRGIDVEPDPARAGALARARPRDIIVAAALGESPGTLPFFEASLPDYSTFRADYAEIGRRNGIAFRERPVAVTTLAEICARHAPETIDFLTIDAEGWERSVILGGDWKRWRPRAVVVEAIRPGDWSRSDVDRIVPSHGEWEYLLLDAGYRFAHFDGLNRFYLRSEDEGLLYRLGFPAGAVVDGFVTAGEMRLRGELESAAAKAAALAAELQSAAADQERLRGDAAALHRTIQALRAEADSLLRELEPFRNLGPLALSAAFRIRAASLRYPKLAAGLKRLLGR